MPSPHVLITGATRGIGLACAHALQARGYHVVGLARSDKANDFPGDLYAVDVADRKAMETVLHTLTTKYSLTGLVNNVGAVGPELVEDIDLDTVDHVFQVNLGAAIQCVKSCIPSMRENGSGRIVSIASELALGLPTRTAYGGAKAALISATRTWALELARYRITANAISPGAVDTDFFLQNNPVGSSEYERKLQRIPLGRFGRPDDIAATVAFLMSPEAEYITGQTISVDGGSSLGGVALL